MGITYRAAKVPGLEPFTAEVPDGSIIGLIGEDSPALSSLLRMASGLERPVSGEVQASEPRRLIDSSGSLDLGPAATLAMDHALSRHDAFMRAQARVSMERLRRQGSAILFLSHEQDLLRELCDEVWWIHDGRLAAKGDPRDVLKAYNAHVGSRLGQWASGEGVRLAPSMRRGDGRAEIVSLQTLDAQERPSMVLNNGERAGVRVGVRFHADVEDPVVGIMIRTRIGFEVFGTNTELERVKLGPVAAGDSRTVVFSFECNLCPQEYTLTAASHDPNGVWHDWMEDAVAFSVAAPRYTAGVVDLKANVRVE